MSKLNQSFFVLSKTICKFFKHNQIPPDRPIAEATANWIPVDGTLRESCSVLSKYRVAATVIGVLSIQSLNGIPIAVASAVLRYIGTYV